ncbi:uncharacterized protein BO72DRAFT_22380 [Aspergillus fijiensis CBS 313.89]|uniref:Uncharacterized protein n=1 Tax=Aspergillus fijiensis CBS 313.89 TaxID=1448319 RepID=A0A8G1W1L9_9EURO|nr:uncharacterized protein BO72DRAFT_22380 [Aspergillus fijiensis CBS 313.89]RAK79833.1 hypothetical protein BO72DRAFT_22380 [Aspergillus fijiensis CBS 313.89]
MERMMQNSMWCGRLQYSSVSCFDGYSQIAERECRDLTVVRRCPSCDTHHHVYST